MAATRNEPFPLIRSLSALPLIHLERERIYSNSFRPVAPIHASICGRNDNSYPAAEQPPPAATARYYFMCLGVNGIVNSQTSDVPTPPALVVVCIDRALTANPAMKIDGPHLCHPCSVYRTPEVRLTIREFRRRMVSFCARTYRFNSIQRT